MSGVYIKGMEMPTSCLFCALCFGANEFCPLVKKYAKTYGRHDDCPLISVPDHGRLIDADALASMWCRDIKDMLGRGVEYIDSDVTSVYSDFMHDVRLMPTIIPGEEAQE